MLLLLFFFVLLYTSLYLYLPFYFCLLCTIKKSFCPGNKRKGQSTLGTKREDDNRLSDAHCIDVSENSN